MKLKDLKSSIKTKETKPVEEIGKKPESKPEVRDQKDEAGKSLELEELTQQVEHLENENKDLQNQNEELINKLKRALADYQNLQTRVEKQRLSFVNQAKEEILQQFLPVYDNLHRALLSIKDEGLSFVADQFKTILVNQGLTEFGQAGDQFDPYLHDCVDLGKGKEGEILAVLEKGFKLGEKVIRPARVKVGKENKS